MQNEETSSLHSQRLYSWLRWAYFAEVALATKAENTLPMRVGGGRKYFSILHSTFIILHFPLK